MGRPVTVLGSVVRGSRRGRILGFPTANINPHHEAIPPSGVYAVRVLIGRTFRKGVLNIGVRPTFFEEGEAGEEPRVEVHIFDFAGRIYGEDIEIFFVKKIREERKFDDREALAAGIRRDEIRARAILRPLIRAPKKSLHIS